MPSNVPRRVTIFTKGHRTGGKVIAVPDTFEEFLLKAKNKLGLHGNALVAVYNKSGGLLEDVELIRYMYRFNFSEMMKSFMFLQKILPQ